MLENTVDFFCVELNWTCCELTQSEERNEHLLQSETFYFRRLVRACLADDFRYDLMNRMNHRPQHTRLDGNNTTRT